MGADPLYTRAPVTRRDERLFVAKLTLLVTLVGVGVALVLSEGPLVVAGVILLSAMYIHATELSHQCLHHSAFRSARAHRIVGVPLGMPLLVVYSHYRVRHLQHHHYLGTDQDTEFFGFDTRGPLRVSRLARAMFDYGRIAVVLRDVMRSAGGRWRYDLHPISPAMRRRIVAEHRFLGLLLVLALSAILLGHGVLVLLVWVLPLLLAVPLHFLIELPEHLLCDQDSTDVLHNTRSITSNPITTWFTNGNNFHIEHHAAMSVPMNRLGERHPEVRVRAQHVEVRYADFYLRLWRVLRTRRGSTAPVSAEVSDPA